MNTKQEILPNAVYTTEEAAELLGLNALTIQKYVRTGQIKATKIGNKWYRINGQSLLEFMGEDHLDIPAVMLEHALLNLEMKQTKPIVSNFANMASAIKSIAMDAKTKGDLINHLAGFINEIIKHDSMLGSTQTKDPIKK